MDKIEQNVVEVPEGFKMNAKGYLVPMSKIKDVDLNRDILIDVIFEQIVEASEILEGLKGSMMDLIDQHIDDVKKKHGIEVATKKGNLTLTSYDGNKQIKVAISDTITLNEQLDIAKALIFECVNEWKEGANDNLKVIVTDIFELNNTGNMKVKDILGLRNYNIEDDRWQKAMQLITESILIEHSKRYIRFYQRNNPEDKREQIKLAIT